MQLSLHFMGLFSSSPQGYLGIDISAPSVKVVELRRNGGKVALATYGFSERFADAVTPNQAQLDVVKTSDLIKKICHKAKTSSNSVLVSLPTFSVFSSIININDSVAKKDITAAINWEAKKVIPLPLQDIVLDWQKISFGATEEEKGSSRILLTGAPKALIQNYVSVFKAAEMNLLSLETEIFALIRSLLGNDRSPVMIVQLGSTTTNIFVVDKSVPVINRSIAAGGINITQAIAEQAGIPLIQAEQFKHDLVHKQDPDGQVMPAMIIDALAPVVNEIKYILDVFGGKDGRRVEKIMLTGGGALLPGLSDYLSDYFNINTVVGDPWFRIAYPFELKPILEKIGPRMAVAIGLAMREFDRN